MAALIRIWEAANLFVGQNPNAEADKSLVLENVHIPDLEEMTQDWHPGGAFGTLTIGGLGLKPLVLEFKTVGIDEQTMSQFGLFGTPQTHFTIYRAARIKQDNSLESDKCVVFGRNIKITNDAFKRGDLYGQSYTISEIIHYELVVGGTQKYYYDFFAQQWIVDGIDQMGGVNNALGISA